MLHKPLENKQDQNSYSLTVVPTFIKAKDQLKSRVFYLNWQDIKVGDDGGGGRSRRINSSPFRCVKFEMLIQCPSGNKC